MPRVTAVQVIRALGRDGWYRDHQTGSHVFLVHPVKSGRVTVPMHKSKTLKLATLDSIIEDASLTVDDLRRLL